MDPLRATLSIVIATLGASIGALAVWLLLRAFNQHRPFAWLCGLFRPFAIKLIIGYFVLSILTLPSLNRFWFGEFPILGVIQIPKTLLAHWLRREVVMRAIVALGLSNGSFSPDYIAARFPGLLLAYLILLGSVYIVVWIRTRMASPYRRLSVILLATAVVDFVVTVEFTGGRGGLTIY